MKRSDVKDVCQLGITIPKEDRDRFNLLCDNESLTQAEMLLKLMDNYMNESPAKGEQEFTLTMYMHILSRGELMHKKTFKGTLCCSSEGQEDKPLDRATAQKLYDDFGCPLYVKDAYLYRHWIKLFYHSQEQRYIAHELISVRRNPNYQGERRITPDEYYEYVMPDNVYEKPFEMSRFCYVDSFLDFSANFGRYSSIDELYTLGATLATDIGDNDELMDTLFKKYNPTD